MARGDHDDSGSVAASATSTSPLGSTCSQRGCLRPCANACTANPWAALGVAPFGHGSFATDHLTVGSQLSFGSARRGWGPYPGGRSAERVIDGIVPNRRPVAAAIASGRQTLGLAERM